MKLLERMLPSLRKSPAMAELKKDLEREKEENARATSRVLSAVETMVGEFDLIRSSKRKHVLAAIKAVEKSDASARKR